MTLNASFQRIKHACDFQSLSPGACAITFKDGWAYASNLNLMAKVPFEGVPDCVVPVTEFQTATRAFPDATTARATEKNLIVKSSAGASKATVPLLEVAINYDVSHVDTQPVPERFSEAISDVTPFASTDRARAWTMGARIDKRTITATNNVVLVQSDLGKGVAFEGVTLSTACLKFLSANRGKVKRWGVSSTEVRFEFEDGGWVRASRLNADMPARVPELLDSVFNQPVWDAPDEWREEVMSRLQYVDGLITLEPSRIHGKRDATTLECFVDSPVDEPLIFGPEFLDVVRLATSYDFSNPTQPISFKGEHARGVIAARSLA